MMHIKFKKGCCDLVSEFLIRVIGTLIFMHGLLFWKNINYSDFLNESIVFLILDKNLLKIVDDILLLLYRFQ